MFLAVYLLILKDQDLDLMEFLMLAGQLLVGVDSW